MPKTLIKQFSKQKREARDDQSRILHVSELFCDTIQGEGISSGMPSTFLRLQGCTLQCAWCDTLEVWKEGNPYSVMEIIELFEQNGMIEKFKKGQHLILTGGSPLKQEEALLELMLELERKHKFTPIVEVENECVLIPQTLFPSFVTIWNNSPKLSNSQMKKRARLRPNVVKLMSCLQNSYFKFVISSKRDWEEVEKDFLEPGLIRRDQIILMPEGENQEQLEKSYEATVELAVRENVMFRNREHIVIWNKKTGV